MPGSGSGTEGGGMCESDEGTELMPECGDGVLAGAGALRLGDC